MKKGAPVFCNLDYLFCLIMALIKGRCDRAARGAVVVALGGARRLALVLGPRVRRGRDVDERCVLANRAGER